MPIKVSISVHVYSEKYKLCSCWLWTLLYKQLFKVHKAVESSDENVKFRGTELLSKDFFFVGV